MTTAVVVTCHHKQISYLFGVFESREKYLEEIKPHVEARKGDWPQDWGKIEIGFKTLTAEEVEINTFQELI